MRFLWNKIKQIVYKRLLRLRECVTPKQIIILISSGVSITLHYNHGFNSYYICF